MSKKMIYLVSVIFVLALVTTSYGIQIFDFEGGLNGWVSANGAVTLSNSTIGVVTGSQSMKVAVSTSGWKQAAKVSILGLYSTYMANTTVEMDVTYDPCDWVGAAGWAQFLLRVNSTTTGILDQSRPDTDDVNPGFTSGWDPVNFPTLQTRHVTWNIADTHAALAGGPGAVFELIFVVNFGGGLSKGAYYIDNVQLTGLPRNESPSNGDMGVKINPVLSWAPTPFDDKYDVYVGADSETVADANRASHPGLLYYSQNQDANYYPLAGTLDLDYGQTYYWRIDGVNNVSFLKGDVWHFTTVYIGKDIVIGDWENQMDGWRVKSGSPATTSYSTTGATLNDYAIEVNVPDGWRETIEIPLATMGLVDDLLANNTFSLDVTWVTSEWTGSGWAQIESIVISGNGIGSNQLNPVGDTSNPGSPGSWDTTSWGASNTRTITWDYSVVDLGRLPAEPGTLVLIICTNSQTSVRGLYHFDNARLYDPTRASEPEPADGVTDVQVEPTLSWTPGSYADTHDVYFGTDETMVDEASRTNDPCGVLIKQDYDTNSINIVNDVGALDFGTTYYWRIDEINDANLWRGGVWSFTTGYFLTIEDFESYNPNLTNTWKAGGKATVSLSTDPVYEGDQAMKINYNNNNPSPYYSEAWANTVGPNSIPKIENDWTINGFKALSLYFRGNPDVRGSFDANTYTINGAGWTIWGTADGFHYAYKNLTKSTWQITAKVLSVENTSSWAKAGVMVRQTLDPNSKHVMVVVTPENGVAFQCRDLTGGETDQLAQVSGITAPYWVRLTRVNSPPLIIVAEYSANGTAWTQIGDDLELGLTTPLYIGLCVTSSNSGELCTSQFSNITMLETFPPGTAVGGSWAHRDIGVPYNDPEPVYVVLQDSDSNAAWYYPDTSNPDNADQNATQTGNWTQWMIELSEFSVQGVDLTDVQKMYIGVGNWDEPTQDGSGSVYIDDIQLHKPYCILSERSADFAKADYAPVSYFVSGDCMIDEQEIEIMARDWLVDDEVIATTDPNTDNLVAYYPFDEGQGSTAEDVVGDHDGTLEGGVTWMSPGVLDGNAIHVDGTAGARVSIGTWDPVGLDGMTLAAWVKWAGPHGTSQGIICKRDTWNINDLMFMFEIDTPGSNGAIQLRQHSDAATDVSSAPGTMMRLIGEWAHVAVTFNGTDATLYLNGRAVGSGPFTMGNDPGAGMVIGNTNSADGWPDCPESFNGDIDEVRIYNRAMYTEEVAYLADLTPGDGEQHVPVPSPAELYEDEDPGQRSVNFRDFAFLATTWLEEEMSL